MILTPSDKEFIGNRGNSEVEVHNQFEILKRGIPFVNLVSPAIANDGVIVLSQPQKDYYLSLFESKRSNYSLLKFTPASGAATRMFKFLFSFLEDYDHDKESINAFINKTNASDLRLFLIGLESFPFYKKIRKRLRKKYHKNENSTIDLDHLRFIELMLDDNGFQFGHKPKGLFPFHKYKNHIATAFEEHLFEGAAYACNEGVANLHFTISNEHHEAFENQFKKRLSYIESKTKVKFISTYSYQSHNTDTVALTSKNELVRNVDGQILFRPGGHGALINNLNDQQADIVFIKNIDNVVVNRYKQEVVVYKKILGGMLIELQEKVFRYLRILDEAQKTSETLITEITDFLQKELYLKVHSNFKNLSSDLKVTYLKEQLNRPLRVCGMVKNEGEPGGGPFWVRDQNGMESLQIVEGVQIDPLDKAQQKILNESSYFNPVDIVCGLKDYKGEKFNLLDFVETKAGFIATKSYLGNKIKVLEHPGLWNGGMADWNTIFVEVPLVTFNPVKTVNDLLKPAHQVKQ